MDTLSKGMVVQVHLALIAAIDARLMILDEPTLGLDVLGSQVVTEYLGHLRDEGKAVILTTHHLDEAERLCTRFGLLHKGRQVSEGTLGELRAATGCTGLTEMFLKLSQAGPALDALGDGETTRKDKVAP